MKLIRRDVVQTPVSPDTAILHYKQVIVFGDKNLT